MELFYTSDINGNIAVLGEQESKHCVNVLRHREGDKINIVDGMGNLCLAIISSIAKKEVVCEILEMHRDFGAHNYSLTMAVCPTKNMDRYEWFMEKATEIGVDKFVPIIGEHSERKIIKPERCERVIVSAAKQSIKAKFPILSDQISVIDFICSEHEGLKLIAFCEEDRKFSLPSALNDYLNTIDGTIPKITLLIGPEGDFSIREITLALEKGFTPIHLGESRLRTETAALAAVSYIYFRF